MSCTISDFQYAYHMVGPTGPTTSMFQIHCQNPTIFTTENFCLGNNTNGYPTHAWNMWVRYQNAGCSWFDNRLNHWNAQLANMNPNPGNQQGYAHYQHKQAKIAQFEYLKVTCGCGPPIYNPTALELTQIITNTDSISYRGEKRAVSINGTPGAKFTLTLINNAGVNKLTYSESSIDGIIPGSGVYKFTQNFPSVTASDRYTIEVKPKAGTTLNKGFVKKTTISQWYTTTLTLTMISDDNASDYATFPASVLLTGDATIRKGKVKRLKSTTTTSLSWEIKGASGGAITLSRQPKATDFSNNIANTLGEGENTFFDVRALSNKSGDKIKISSADAAKITTGLTVKEHALPPLTQLEKSALKITGEEEYVFKSKAKAAADGPTSIYPSEEATAKEVTVSAIDADGQVVTLSTSQNVKYGTTMRFDNGGTVVSFSNLKAVQSAPSVIKVTADIKTQSIGIQDVTSRLALDNFITT
tara:strand:- start:1917 stop:3332 length:1416 start_codon:yes stop_codon:yes gene_type:complete